MPHRTSPGGCYRIDRTFDGVGRIALSSGTTKVTMYRRLNTMLTELYEDGYIDILEAIRDRRLTLQEVYQAKRVGRLPYAVSDMVLRCNLWDAVDDWLPASAPTEASRKRYEVSWRALRKYGPLRDNARVRDLIHVDWEGLRMEWPNSAADWNRMRSAVSRFLSVSLDDKYHPFRRKVMNRISRAREPRGRVPDITPDLFWRLIEQVPEHAQPAFVTLAVTGMRIGEYLQLEDHHLLPHTRSIQVPGTKTASSADLVRVGEHAWEWVTRAVPPPLQYRQLYRYFKRAAKKVGNPKLTIHDLRHLHGMLLSDAGVPEAKIQVALRHSDPGMTRRYTRQRDRGETAQAVDEILFPRAPDGEEGAG